MEKLIKNVEVGISRKLMTDDEIKGRLLFLIYNRKAEYIYNNSTLMDYIESQMIGLIKHYNTKEEFLKRLKEEAWDDFIEGVIVMYETNLFGLPLENEIKYFTDMYYKGYDYMEENTTSGEDEGLCFEMRSLAVKSIRQLMENEIGESKNVK